MILANVALSPTYRFEVRHRLITSHCLPPLVGIVCCQQRGKWYLLLWLMNQLLTHQVCVEVPAIYKTHRTSSNATHIYATPSR